MNSLRVMFSRNILAEHLFFNYQLQQLLTGLLVLVPSTLVTPSNPCTSSAPNTPGTSEPKKKVHVCLSMYHLLLPLGSKWLSKFAKKIGLWFVKDF